MHVVEQEFDFGEKSRMVGWLHGVYPEYVERKFRPAVLIFPGGGYSFVSEREAEPVAKAFFNQGYQVFVLYYPVKEAAANMQPLLAASCAVLQIRRQAEKWNILEDKIAVCGFSAGGHLAACISTLYAHPELHRRMEMQPGENRPDLAILAYPVISSGEFMSRGGSIPVVTGGDEKMMTLFSVEYQVTENTPPMFLWHAVDDDSVPVENVLLMMQALRRKKVPFEGHLFETGGHGISMCNQEVGSENPHCAHWFGLCTEWMAQHFSMGALFQQLPLREMIE